MDPTPEERLRLLGLELPDGSTPVGTYLKSARWGNLLFLSGHGPVRHDGTRVIGKVGSDLDPTEAYDAARLTGLGLLSTVNRELGELGRVARVLKLLGMVNGAPGFDAAPEVIDGCSDLLVAVLGEDAGRHARSAIVVAGLPFGIPVEIEMVVAVRD